MAEGLSNAPLLAMRGIRKRFGNVEVLRGVDLTLGAGETLALLGENGAGKSTLMKILSGDYARDGGEIQINGAPVTFHNPREAQNAGVRVIYQELNAAPDLCVAENVLLGHLPSRFGMVDWKSAHAKARDVLALLAADIDTRETMGDLSVGKQQIVEIAKALAFGDTRILVLDEPTAALTNREIERLFSAIGSLCQQGVGIIYISHRLDEVEQIAQRVLVLRDGGVAGDVPIAQTSRRDMVRLMVGRDVEQLYPARSGQPGEPLLQVENLTRAGAFDNVSFTVYAGEIVGMYGLLGAGQAEVARALFGAERVESGTLKIGGAPVHIGSPREARRNRIGLVPEDRKREGLVLPLSVSENVTLGNWQAVSQSGILLSGKEAEVAGTWINRLAVRAGGGANQEIGTLSGGNQQKVVIARWLQAGVRVLVLMEPTRGVDVGARADIYKVIENLRIQGMGIVLVSTDLEEMLGLSDRTLVFARGKIVREFSRDEATQENLLGAASSGDAQKVEAAQ